MPPLSSDKKLLLIGASRGLGFALAEEYLKRGWHVVATERDQTGPNFPIFWEFPMDGFEIETVDIVFPEQVAALRARLASRQFDLLFVNAGVKNDDRETIADVSTDEFVRVMITNALSPMRVIEALQGLVLPNGTIAIMSSGQGSISNNESGHFEVYRGSKAALNMFMRSFAARRADDQSSIAHGSRLGANGLGGPRARLSIEESIPNLVNTIDAQAGKSGLHYLDYLGRKVPW